MSAPPCTPEQLELLKSVERLIPYMLRKIGGQKLVDDEDVRQIVWEHLVRAVRTWDPAGGRKWSSYASHAIILGARHEWMRARAKKRGGSGVGKNRKEGAPSLPRHTDIEPLEAVLAAPELPSRFDFEPDLSALTPKQRDVVTLLLRGYSRSDVGRITGRSRQAVSLLWNDARKRLEARRAD